VDVIRIKEIINGRSYVIELQAVGASQWRAQLARREATTALMPFYGPTPDDAAGLLRRWLTKANAPSPS
jgi:hypothetical protein